MHAAMKFEITILDTQEKFLCTSKEHLLKGMSKMGKRGIPSGCHGGGCGVCKIQICAGEVSNLVMSRTHVSLEEEKRGIVLACRSFPKKNIDLKVIGKLQDNIVKTIAKKKYGFV